VTNKTHPITAPAAVVAELASAAVAVSRDSTDPLAPVTALAPVDLTPAGVPVPIDTDDEVYALHMAGYTPSQVAHHFTKVTGRRWTIGDVDAAISRVAQSNIGRTQAQLTFAAQLELDRMDAALKAIWPSVQDGNLQAMDRWLKLSAERRKMLGLDAPDVQVQLRLGAGGDVDYSTLSTEELKTLQGLQRKASSASRQKVIRGASTE
jgi:hypothetical protein